MYSNLSDSFVSSSYPFKLIFMPKVTILPFRPDLARHFKSISKIWLEELFSLEPFDLRQLESPEETIIQSGGAIIFAQLDGEIVGTVALYKSGETTFEMIKMGVLPAAQGKGIGMLLAENIIEKAKEMGGKKLILYSNTKLKAALKIYEKLGFTPVIPEGGKYSRCDVKMEMNI